MEWSRPLNGALNSICPPRPPRHLPDQTRVRYGRHYLLVRYAVGLLDNLTNPFYNEQQTGLLNTAQNRLGGLLDQYNRYNPLFERAMRGRPIVGNMLDNIYRGVSQFGGVGQRMLNGETLAGLDLVGAGSMGLAGVVSPKVAKTLNISKSLPNDDIFLDAVRNTPGANITEDGLSLRISRSQRPEQGMQESVRGGVFYLPEGSAQAKHYSTGRNGYGGSEKISGETLVRNPLFVKGATGGKAPEAAYDTLIGKGAYEAMRRDALNVNWGRNAPAGKGGPSVDEFLDKYAPELSGYGSYILENSKQGNQLAYALQEAAVGSAARKAGHDVILGYSKGRNGKGHFISEIFDVRESHYPDKFGGYRVHPDLEK